MLLRTLNLPIGGSAAAASRSCSRARATAARPLAAAPQGAANNAVPAAAARFATRLEHMDTVLIHPQTLEMSKYADMNMAERELGAFCASLEPDEEPEKCWQAYSYLERRRESAAAGCGSNDPAACAELEKLNGMAHDLLATGSMDDMVATFATLARVEEMRAARAAKAAAAIPAEDLWTTADEGIPAEPPADPLHIMFVRMDANGDGRLSMAEFRQSMAMLGEELDGGTVAQIGEAMDLFDGFITEEQFRDIVEAERINSKSDVAKLWRHHHLNPRPHIHTSW